MPSVKIVAGKVNSINSGFTKKSNADSTTATITALQISFTSIPGKI